MQTLQFLRRAHDQALALAKPFKLDGLDAQHRAALMLYGTIVELAGAFTTLCENRLWVGAPAVARCALEAYVDFRNVVADANYVSNLEAHFVVEHLKTLRAAKDEANPYFAGLRELGELDELINAAEQRKAQLRQKGYGRLTVRDRFDRAEAEHVYLSVYHSLSDDAHNGIATLYRRQLNGNNQLQFAIYPENPRGDFLPIVDLMASTVTDVTMIIHDLLKTKESKSARDLHGELSEIRKAYKVAA